MIWIVIAVILLLLIGGLVPMLIKTVPIAKRVYNDTLVRNSPEKWGRVCSDTTNEEQVQMWNEGIIWAEDNAEFRKELTVENDGLKLCGEYFDFGKDKCVVILPGRCESLIYSYYFAKPYKDAGCNVLVIDTRAHGNSEGKYNTIGYKESGDTLTWINYVENSFGIHEFYIHAICIGTSTAMLLMTKDNCPESVKCLVTEGCYSSFRETYKRHMIYDKRPLFPVLDLIILNIRMHTGSKLTRNAPIRLVKKMRQPVLFLFGELDAFSIPEKSRKIFDRCASKKKKLIWFDKGAHSHLRINNTEKYDREIIEFLSEI